MSDQFRRVQPQYGYVPNEYRQYLPAAARPASPRRLGPLPSVNRPVSPRRLNPLPAVNRPISPRRAVSPRRAPSPPRNFSSQRSSIVPPRSVSPRRNGDPYRAIPPEIRYRQTPRFVGGRYQEPSSRVMGVRDESSFLMYQGRDYTLIDLENRLQELGLTRSELDYIANQKLQEIAERRGLEKNHRKYTLREHIDYLKDAGLNDDHIQNLIEKSYLNELVRLGYRF